MIAAIKKGCAKGTVTVPPSKSMAHRLLINGALTEGSTLIHHLPSNEDISATLDCLRALGAGIDLSDTGDCTVSGITGDVLGDPAKVRLLNCRESGSTLRFLLPVALMDGIKTEFTGSPYLFTRPLSVYRDLCTRYGFLWEQTPKGVLVQGKLPSDVYTFPGNISSQFITGLLLALPGRREDSVLRLTTELESSSYVNMTMDTLSSFGIRIVKTSDREFYIPGGQHRQTPGEMTVEGDQSGAAFFAALNILDGSVQIEGLKEETRQGDRVWKDFFPLFKKTAPTLSIKDCPDLGPILMVLAAACSGAVLTDTGRLKLKESDRGMAMAEELEKCSVKVRVEPERIIIPGGQLQAPTCPLQGHNDHRIVMALAILLTQTGGEISEAEAVRKSMPAFWEFLGSLKISVKLKENR